MSRRARGFKRKPFLPARSREVELQDRGIAVPSVVSLRGRTWLHVAVTNHRSRREDFDVLAAGVVRLGGELAGAAGRDPHRARERDPQG